MRAVLRKFIARFFHFMVSLIYALNRIFGLLWPNFAPNLHCWTLNRLLRRVRRLCRVCTEENIAAVSASVNYDHQLSIRRRSQQLGLCYSTMWIILRKYLGVKPFKIQLVQELKPIDLPQRRIFGEWSLERLAEGPLFIEKLCSATKLIFGSMGT